MNKTKGIAGPVDVHVGQKLRNRRSLLGMSQDKLATSIGLTFQQLQKYERGTNRISAGRLWMLSRALEVPIDYFYEGLAEPVQKLVPDETLSRKETLDLVRVWYKLPETVRRAFYGNMKMLSKQYDPEAPQ
jgi:transcriptional regulator with XRE-family HTH domain